MKGSKSKTKVTKRRERRMQYDQDAFKQALDLAKQGNTSLYRVSKDYGIPQSTLRKKLKLGQTGKQHHYSWPIISIQ